MSLTSTARSFANEMAQGRRRHPHSFSRWDALRNFPRWSKALRSGASALADEAPWIPFAARDFLEKIVLPTMKVCEYGSGGSTLFFADRVRELVSIEHDELWAGKVSAAMESRRSCQWKLQLRPPHPEASAVLQDPAKPEGYVSTDPQYAGKSFHAYATAIDTFPDGHFDIVLIDGRARPSCSKHALPKVRAGGYLVLDNAERDIYRACHEMPAALGWKAREFFGPGPYVGYFWGATIWQNTHPVSSR
jgi:hypothetical protein